MTEISIREKEKWTNKGTDKQEMTDSGKTTKWKKNGKINTGILIFSYTIHLDTVYMYTKFEEAGINRS